MSPTPRLARRARVRPDPRDGRPVLLSPERGLRLSDTAAAIVALCDGTRTVDAIADTLADRYGAPRARVAADVGALLGDLAQRALVEGLEGMPSATAASRDDRDAAPEPAGGAPYTLVAELTPRCAHACPNCSNPTRLVGGRDELTTGEWLRVVDEAADLGVMQIHLSGGEPLARADLAPIASRARARDLYENLVTIGVPLHLARLEALAPTDDCVQLSVQDASAEASDRVAGLASSFDQKMRVAGWVRQLGLSLTVNVVVHRDNIDRTADVVAMAERLGADRLELANVQLVSWALTNAAALLPSRAQIDRARAVAAREKARLAGRMEVVFVLPDWHADRPRACMDGWGRRFVVVAPDGVVLPCHAARSLPIDFEGVRGGSLAHAWREGQGMRAFRGEAWMADPCRTCDRRGVDFGGCRCQAFALTGDARATDPACALAPTHGLVRDARATAEGKQERRFVYRGR